MGYILEGGDSGVTSKRTVIGGTFDRLHAGHHLLIERASQGTEHLEIWITDEIMARQKGVGVLCYQDRMAEIEQLVVTLGIDFSLHTLVDNFGGAESRSDIDRIVCTPETQFTCDRINEHRIQHNLPSLEVEIVPHVLDESGNVLSSSRIRDGRIDREGRLWLSSTETRMIGDDVIADLKRPFGTLFKGPAENPSVAFSNATLNVANQMLVSVGDIVTKTAVISGFHPRIGVIDGHTQRNQDGALIDEMETKFDSVIHCQNPASMVTSHLIEACKQALDEVGTCLIGVDGAEDLAPIPLILLAPLGFVLIYGQPNTGVVQRHVDESAKSNTRKIWQRMIAEAQT